MKHIEFQERENTVILTVSRERALNALNLDVLNELDGAFDIIDTEKTRAVIITGAGKKSFVAGADIGLMKNFTKEQAKDFTLFGSGIFRKIETFPVPVIAAVNGYALGGGLELAMACDFRVASENAIFGLPETGLGIIPGFGGTQRLMRLIPVGKAKEMIYGGTRIDAAEALQIGLVNSVVSLEELMEHAYKLAGRIAKNAPGAVEIAKQVMNQGADERMGAALTIESESFVHCFEKEEQVERMTAFLGKANKQ